jgi:hypothetical protein
VCPTCCMRADDLGITTNDPGEMQTMLNKLRTYAEKKGLTVNTAKSEVVHFNICLSFAESVHIRWCGASREGQVQIFGRAA